MVKGRQYACDALENASDVPSASGRKASELERQPRLVGMCLQSTI